MGAVGVIFFFLSFFLSLALFLSLSFSSCLSTLQQVVIRLNYRPIGKANCDKKLKGQLSFANFSFYPEVRIEAAAACCLNKLCVCFSQHTFISHLYIKYQCSQEFCSCILSCQVLINNATEKVLTLRYYTNCFPSLAQHHLRVF